MDTYFVYSAEREDYAKKLSQYQEEQLGELHKIREEYDSRAKELNEAGFVNTEANNSSRMILGNCRIARYIMQGVFKLFPFDFLSASANCIAVKPA